MHLLKKISLVLCLQVVISNFAYGVETLMGDGLNVCLRSYEVELAHRARDPYYRLKPGHFTSEEIRGFGDLPKTTLQKSCGFINGALVELILSPLTVIASPKIYHKVVTYNKFRLAKNILEDSLKEEGEEQPFLEKFTEKLQKIYPDGDQINTLEVSRVLRYAMSQKTLCSSQFEAEPSFLSVFPEFTSPWPLEKLFTHYPYLEDHYNKSFLPPDPLEGLDIQIVDESQDDDDKKPLGDCSICLEKMERKAPDQDLKPIKTSCGHYFHLGCITKIRGSEKLCPLCRKDLILDH